MRNRQEYPDFFNAPVPSFGDLTARLLVVGLAPGLKGANRTGRPFTGDYAGIVLYRALLKHGFAKGSYGERRDDGLRLIDCRITNAARCVPPANLPKPEEVRTCNRFLVSEIAAMPSLRVILALGQVAHGAVLRALGQRQSACKFGHGKEHIIAVRRDPRSATRELRLLSSYHCSRYNMNTGTLTEAMFDDIVTRAARLVRRKSPARVSA